MRIRLVWEAVFLFLLPLSLRAEEDGVTTFSSFWKPDMEVTEGVCPVYRRGDKVYLEIRKSALECDWVVTAQIDRGFGLRNRLLPGIGAFRLKKEEGGRLGVYLARRMERCSAKGKDGDSRLPIADLREPDWYWEIVAEGREGYVVDFTGCLRNGSELFDCEYEGLREEREEAFELTDIAAAAEGVCFRMKRFFRYMPENKGAEMMLASGYLPLELSLGIRLLPGGDAGLQSAVPGESYRKMAYTDYGTDPCGAAEEYLAVHWMPEDGGGLTLWADAGLPESVRHLLQEVVDDWNKEEAVGAHGLPLSLKRAESPADACCPLLVSSDIGGKGVEYACREHAGDGRLFCGRLHVGVLSSRELLKWRLEHATVDGEGRLCLLPEDEAEAACMKERLAFALRGMMGMDTALLCRKRTEEECFRHAREQLAVYGQLMAQKAGFSAANGVGGPNKRASEYYAVMNELALDQYLAVADACHSCRSLVLRQQMCLWLYGQLQKEAEEGLPGLLSGRTAILGQGARLDRRLSEIWKRFWQKDIWTDEGCFVLAEVLGETGGRSLSPERMRAEWACVSALAAGREETEERFPALFCSRLKEKLQGRLKRSRGKEAAFVELLLKEL